MTDPNDRAPEEWFLNPRRLGRPREHRETMPPPSDHDYVSLDRVDSAIAGLLAGADQAGVVAATGLTPAVVSVIAQNVVDWGGSRPTNYVPRDAGEPGKYPAAPRRVYVPTGSRLVKSYRCRVCCNTVSLAPCRVCQIRDRKEKVGIDR